MKSDGYKNINIEIISYTKNPGKIIWEMLKQTWINLHNVKYDPNSNIIKEFIEDSLYKRLNPTPQETIMIQAVFKNISRVNLAQLTRHRGWLFNSESQMPQKVNHNILIPINMVKSKYYERILKLIKDSQELYNDMTLTNDIDKNNTDIPYQDARYILLGGQTCDISASFSLPQLISACGMRLDNNTHDEINYMFRKTILKLKKTVNEDKDLDSLDLFIYNTLLDFCDCFGASQEKSFCCDKLFGNSFKRHKDANKHVEEATNNCLFNYKKLAWYHELIRMYHEEPELLLKGENEMVEKWLSEIEISE